MGIEDIRKELQEWIYAEERAGRSVDMNQLNDRLQVLMQRHNSEPRSDFNGLSPEQMHLLLDNPFEPNCPVQLNNLTATEYMQIPFVKQVLFLMQTLNEKELKLTKNGWLPLKVVAEAYRLGRPDIFLEEYGQKRFNEYDAKAVEFARALLEVHSWTKIRKGMLSLTAKGKKAIANIDEVANEILYFSLAGNILHTVDGHENQQIGNVGTAYSVWLLNKFGSEWRDGYFYQEQYQKVINIPERYNMYAVRVFERLFYWLGIVDVREVNKYTPNFRREFKKTDLLSMIFSFNDK